MTEQDGSEQRSRSTTPEEPQVEEQFPDSQDSALTPLILPDLQELNGDLKLSRKREREVSLEPATPSAPAVDVDKERVEFKDRLTPAKKNRVNLTLDATDEEEDEPVLSCSPPHESKIHQIRQGVEDLTWQKDTNGDKEDETKEEAKDDDDKTKEEVKDDDDKTKEEVKDDDDKTKEEVKEDDDKMEDETKDDNDKTEDEAKDDDDKMEDEAKDDDDKMEATTVAPVVNQKQPNETSEEEDQTQVLLSVVRGENPPIVHDAVGEDEQGDDADVSEKPQDALPEDQSAVSTSAEVIPTGEQGAASPPTKVIPTAGQSAASPPAEVIPTAEPASVPLPNSRRDSESDADQEKGLKRKLADRSVSQHVISGESLLEKNSVISETGAIKRQRDDPDEDANPRLTKRPTPPPDEEEGTKASGPNAPSPVQLTPASVPLPRSRHDSESDTDQEKGLKRKLADRSGSQHAISGEGPLEKNIAVPETCAVKRQRDDPDEDANPRLTKRPTPPPDEEEGTKSSGPNAQSSTLSTPAVTPKLGGFMAYASPSSPFSSVTGPSLFNSKSSSPWPNASVTSSGHPSPSLSSSTFSPMSVSTLTSSPLKDSSSKTPTPADAQVHKRSGFEAFASPSSPFASGVKRSKSPHPPFGGFSALSRSRSPSRHGQTHTANAFSAYAVGGAHGFTAHTSKQTSGRGTPTFGEGSSLGTVFGASSSQSKPVGLGIFSEEKNKEYEEGDGEDRQSDGGQTFGERLRAQKDEEEASDEERRPTMSEQDVFTGEEDEDTIYQVRGKLFTLDGSTWKERGTGNLRLNVRREDGAGARLVMRKEAVYTVILNATLFKGMRCFITQDPRYLRFSVLEGGSTTHYNLKVSTTRIAQELLEEINSHVPSE